MGNSTCVACGECVQACPTGALMPATQVDANGVFTNAPDRTVDSVCPYCGVGCQLTYQIKDDHIVAVEGKDGPANHNRLCVKGRFGFDYVHHPDRLTEPLIRKDGVSKHDTDIDPANPYTHFRKATWEEALDAPRSASSRSAIGMASARSPGSARPRGRTKRLICSRSWCAPASAATMSITARGCAMRRRSRR
jgi:predicted molibdopterin-dependent oxidoreductase YjgC